MLYLHHNVFNSLFIPSSFPQIRGTPWTIDYSGRRINVTRLETFFDVKDTHNPAFNASVQQSLQPGTNCTFYLCYKQYRNIPPFIRLGKTSPASCVNGKLLHIHTHTHTHTHTHRSSFIRPKQKNFLFLIHCLQWFSATHSTESVIINMP